MSVPSLIRLSWRRGVFAALAASLLIGHQTYHAGFAAAQSATDLRAFLITEEEVGDDADMSVDTEGSDDRGRWVQRRWERDPETTDETQPITVDNTVWVARNIEAAKAILGEQEGKQTEFPEAAETPNGPFEFEITPLGEEVRALSACDDCMGKDEIFLHHRVLVRKGAAVSIVYLYGHEAGATQELATWFATQSVSHIPDSVLAQTAPVGPSPAPQAPQAVGSAPAPPSPATASAPGPTQAQPRDLAITEDEAGKDAERTDEDEGSDSRGAWYEARYERPETFSGYRSGPVNIVNRVFVARDVPSAQAIFGEQAKLNEEFPEATREVGDKFLIEGIDDLGEEVVGLSACNESCNSDEEIFVHKRVVTRAGNVVSVVYLWGLSDQEGTTDWHAHYFGSVVMGRVGG